MNWKKLAIFCAGLSAFAGLAMYAGMAAVARAFAALHWSGFAIVTILHIPIIILMGIAWWCVGRCGSGTTLRFINARLVRDAVAEVLPFSQIGGYLAGLRIIGLDGASCSHGAFSMFMDLVLEFGAKLAYLLAGMAALAHLEPQSGLFLHWAFLPALIFGVVIIAIGFQKQIGAVLKTFVSHLIEARTPAWRATLADFAPLLTWERALPCFAIHLGCWLFGAVEAWVTLRLMGISISGGEALAIDSLATSVRTLGFAVPASVGVQEAGYVGVCALFGIAPDSAIAFSLIRRTRDLVIGLPGLMIWQLAEARNVHRLSRQLPL